MKVFQINSFGNLSTGRIAVDIARILLAVNHDCMFAYGRNITATDIKSYHIGNKADVYFDGILSRLTDSVGFHSAKGTRALIRQIQEYSPDIIHLHNLHGYYINIELLFEFLKKYGKPVVWTLHDCWSFTGHCCNFEFVGCEKWKTGCHNCEQLKSYPSSIFWDRSSRNYEKKRRLFTLLDNMVLVTPSQWLCDLVEQSYMKKYPVCIIRNGVNLDTFHPVYGEWKKEHGLEGKHIVLGVAGSWSPTKGLADLVKLSEILLDDYQVVVVGVSEKQLKGLPPNVLGIKRTYDSRELAEIYTAADCFVNPTYDDNFPNVNLEALACGTSVITYQTGGSPEIITGDTGRIVNKGDIEGLKMSVCGMCNLDVSESNRIREACIKLSKEFSIDRCYLKYLNLYYEMLSQF